MLFNTYVFIFCFLPVTLSGFFLLGGWGSRRAALAWLVGASFFYYGWWNPVYVPLLLFSVLFNFGLGVLLGRAAEKRDAPDTAKAASGAAASGGRATMWFGVSVNLALLGYFKYANFFVDTANELAGAGWRLETIVLPLAISFFTFQQIAYLVDAWRGETREYRFLDYCLFVSFFPQLIAGPIVHHKEMLPQFGQRRIYAFNARHFSVGLTIFVIGLFKKVVIADSVAGFANPVFDAAANGRTPVFAAAWTGALAYTLQLYFDFSGYSDMAIGLARMIGVRLPVNFDAPYKAVNIVDFWRRWHITLSRFLRDYLYFGLGGNRRGRARRYLNLMITMLLGGLWHGAGWTFVLWGGLHGAYLCVNHAWHAWRTRMGHDLTRPSLPGLVAARTLTFLAVVVGWVFFRATNFDAAWRILESMCGVHGFEIGRARLDQSMPWILPLLVIVQCVPTTQEIMARYRPVLGWTAPPPGEGMARGWQALWRWRPTGWRAAILAAMTVAVILNLTRVSEFLYFQF